tara:strand:+ start:292 stop:5187 length:4896 start_codon:yes stop_codon:yes gene_type:complete
MERKEVSSCSVLEDYDTCKYFDGVEGAERKGVVLGLQKIIGNSRELINPQNIKDVTKTSDHLPEEFNMTLYKLFDNNINKRMPIWTSINGPCSITLLKGQGKQFLILGEIHCSATDKDDICLSSDNPTNPKQLLADLARYTPSFLDIYTEQSEIEYWRPSGYLGGFLGNITKGPSDLYFGPGKSGKSKRGMPCMDFQWIHRNAPRKAKDAWRMGACLTSRWHYTDIRFLDQSEVDKILDYDTKERYYLEGGRQEYTLEEERRRTRNIERVPSTIEFLFTSSLRNSYETLSQNLNKKIGPKLFLAWADKYLPDNSYETLTKFNVIYTRIPPYFSRHKKIVKDDTLYRKIKCYDPGSHSIPLGIIMNKHEIKTLDSNVEEWMPLSLGFPVWQLAKDVGIKIQGLTTPVDNEVKPFIKLIVAYALLRNDHIIAILESLVMLGSVKMNLSSDFSSMSRAELDEVLKEAKKRVKYHDKLWDIMFNKSLLKNSPRLKKALARTTHKKAILDWARSRYERIISKNITPEHEIGTQMAGIGYLLPHTLLAIAKHTPAKLGEGVFTNQKADTFSGRFSTKTPINILTQLNYLASFFTDLSVINADCYTMARMFKKFNVPKGVNQPEEPHTCVLYFGDSHSANITAFLSQLSGIKLVASNNNKSCIEDVRPYSALGGNKKCCLKLGKFPQPLLWPVGTKQTDFPKKFGEKNRRPGGSFCAPTTNPFFKKAGGKFVATVNLLDFDKNALPATISVARKKYVYTGVVLGGGAYGLVYEYKSATDSIAFKVEFVLRQRDGTFLPSPDEAVAKRLMEASCNTIRIRYVGSKLQKGLQRSTDRLYKYFVMDRLDGDLKKYMRVLNKIESGKQVELRMAEILDEVMTQLQCLADMGLYYTDIKLGNTLYCEKDGAIFLGDIGSAFTDEDGDSIATFPPVEMTDVSIDQGFFKVVSREAYTTTMLWGVGVMAMDLIFWRGGHETTSMTNVSAMDIKSLDLSVLRKKIISYGEEYGFSDKYINMCLLLLNPNLAVRRTMAKKSLEAFLRDKNKTIPGRWVMWSKTKKVPKKNTRSPKTKKVPKKNTLSQKTKKVPRQDWRHIFKIMDQTVDTEPVFRRPPRMVNGVPVVKDEEDDRKYYNRQSRTYMRNRQRVIEGMKRTRNPQKFSDLDEKMRHDKKILLAAIEYDAGGHWGPLHLTSAVLRDDKEVVMHAVRRHPSALEEASERLRDDKEVVMAAVTINGAAITYASPRLRADKDLAILAVRNDLRGESLQLIAPELRDDEDVVALAVEASGLSFEHASDRLRADRDFVITCLGLEPKPALFQFVEESLRGDVGVVRLAIANVIRENERWIAEDPSNREIIPEDYSVWRFVSKHLRMDANFVFEILNQAPIELIDYIFSRDQVLEYAVLNEKNVRLYTQFLQNAHGRFTMDDRFRLMDIIDFHYKNGMVVHPDDFVFAEGIILAAAKTDPVADFSADALAERLFDRVKAFVEEGKETNANLRFERPVLVDGDTQTESYYLNLSLANELIDVENPEMNDFLGRHMPGSVPVVRLRNIKITPQRKGTFKSFIAMMEEYVAGRKMVLMVNQVIGEGLFRYMEGRSPVWKKTTPGPPLSRSPSYAYVGNLRRKLADHISWDISKGLKVVLQ